MNEALNTAPMLARMARRLIANVCRYYLTARSMCCIIYGVQHDAIVIDCSAMRFGTRCPEVFAITTMESHKVNDKIFISGMVIRGRPHGGNPFSPGPLRAETTSKICPEVGMHAFQFRILIALNCGTITVLYRVVILLQPR